MEQIKPDITATIYMYDSIGKNIKSRKTPIPAQQYGCPIFFDNETKGFDCRLLLDQIDQTISPGEKLSGVPIKFLNYDLVKSKLQIGKHFKLWEAGIFGEGEITMVT